METTETIRAEYKEQQAKVEIIKLDIVRINDELQTLSIKLANIKEISQELTEQLQNASHNIAIGKLTSEELLKLKQDLTSNDEVMNRLLEVMSTQRAALEIIHGPSVGSFGDKGRIKEIKKIQAGDILAGKGFYRELDKLNRIRQRLTESIAKNKTSTISSSLSDEVKSIIKSIAASEKHQMSHGLVSSPDIHQDLGKLLYDAAYPAGSSLSFEEVRKDYDEIINAM